MGSDHAASDEKSGMIIARKDSKVFRVGQYGIAFTDSFRMGDILQYSWKYPVYTPTKTNSGLDKFMRTKFVDSVKTTFSENGFGSSPANEEHTGGIFLVGMCGRIFTVDEDYNVGQSVINYAAEGSGAMFALGALYATSKQINPKARLKLALEAATEFTMSVSAPYTFIQV